MKCSMLEGRYTYKDSGVIFVNNVMFYYDLEIWRYISQNNEVIA
jgi:hypothetical protein